MGPAVGPQLREAPVTGEGSWVGLDAHARSVVAGVIDGGSGEVRSLRLPPGGEAMVGWLQTLPAPVQVVHEAGPTGYRLARACAEAGIDCVVAAPSRVRAAADRVRPTGGTPSGWRGCFGSVRSRRCGSRLRRRRRRVIWFVRARTRVAI
jgi:hypothetical protein